MIFLALARDLCERTGRRNAVGRPCLLEEAKGFLVLSAHRPLNWTRPYGGQMPYWARSDLDGVFGGICFGSADFQLQARDEWIGCAADQRAVSIEWVI